PAARAQPARGGLVVRGAARLPARSGQPRAQGARMVRQGPALHRDRVAGSSHLGNNRGHPCQPRPPSRMAEAMTTLPEAEWTRRPDLGALVAALGPDTVRWVGGAVRDTLLGEDVSDVDAATIHRPERVIERLAAAGIRAVPTGIEHGTVTAVLPGGPVEVTTLRRDVSTDGRRATVAFSTEWHDDAARRDFTINALYADPRTLEVHDWFGGLDDLAARRVRFIGDARQRIREDYLRILRYFRFQARFGSRLDDEAEEACAELASTLKGLSRERVAMELLNLLALPDPAPTVARMQARGVLPVILPEAGDSGVTALARLVEEESKQGVAADTL